MTDGRPGVPQPERVRFGPERVAFAFVLVFALGTLPLAASQAWLAPLLLVPVTCAVWVLRAHVVAAPAGLEVCNGLRVSRHAWPQVAGVDVPPRGPVRLLLAGGSRQPLTALPRRQLPRLLAAASRLGAAAGPSSAAGHSP